MSYLTEVLADSPRLLALCDDVSGALTDSSGNSHDGTVGGTLLYHRTGAMTAESPNYSAYAGGDSYVDFGNDADLQITGTIAIECWAKPSSWPVIGGVASLLAKGYDGFAEGYYLRIFNNGGNQLELQVGSYNGTGNGAVWVFATWNATSSSWDTLWNLGDWKHIVGYFDGSAWKIRVNKAEVASTNSATGAVASNSNLAAFGEFLAAANGSPARFLDGDLDGLALYATVPSTDRFDLHYNVALGLTAPTAPSDLTGDAVGTTVNLAWSDNSSDENGFTVQYATENTFTSPVQIDVGPSTSTTGVSLNSSTTYYFRVRAYNGSGVSTWSNTASVTTAITGSGAAQLPALVAEGSSDVSSAASGAATLPSFLAAATGSVGIAGSGAATLPTPIATGSSLSGISGSGAATLPDLRASAAGSAAIGPPPVSMTLLAAITPDGEMKLVRGDAYTAVRGRAIRVKIGSIPNLDGAVVTWRARRVGFSAVTDPVTCTVMNDDDGQVIMIELPGAITTKLVAGPGAYEWVLQATWDGSSTATLLAGTLSVTEWLQ